MRFRKLAVGLSIIAVTNIGAPTIKVFANEVNRSSLAVQTVDEHTSTMKKFDIEKNENFEAYEKNFKVEKELIESVSSNGGQYASSSPSRAIDENPSTHWETGKPNSETFTNEFTVVFKEIVSIDKMTYKVRQDSGTKGFLNEYEIYGSTTDEGDNFTLITKGSGTATRDTVEIKFNENEVKRVKIKFVKANNNWASMSEVGFYKKDMVMDAVNNLFTDETKKQVSEEYSDINKLNEFEDLAKKHPFYEDYKEIINDVKIILNNEQIESNLAITSKFELYENKEYNELFLVDKNNIKSIKNNAGHYASQAIAYAIDGDINTYWETNKSNTVDFNNEVEIEFKEEIEIDRVVYGARQSDSKGFAEEFEIYGSKTSQGDTYQLISTGSHSKEKGLVEGKFNPTKVKRIKFKFKKSNQNWATINEILFYKQDKLSDKVKDIFTDKTMVSLKAEYNNKEAIDILDNEIKEHPLKESLQFYIDRAKNILENNLEQEGVRLTLPQNGDVHQRAKDDLSFVWYGTNLITTGVVATPGEEIEVYVDAEDGKPLPQIMFTQERGHYGRWKQSYNLKPGYNKFTVPEIYDENWSQKPNKGGSIYLVNPYTKEQQGRAPKVVIEGGRNFPVFNEGDDVDKFLNELKNYKVFMDENPNSAVDIFEFNSKRVMFTGTASDAYQVYINEGVDVNESINVWSNLIEKSFEFMGLSDDDADKNHNSTGMKALIRIMQPYGAAYACGDHVGLQKHVADDFLRTDINSINGIIWGTMHEIGHQIDIPARTWSEVTNNMIANEMSLLNGKSCRLDYNRLYKTVALNHNMGELVFEEIDLRDRLGMFWQLEVYSDGYWAQIERMYRERKPSPKDYQEKKDIFAKYASEIIGENLTEYFERYGFELSNECKEELKKLPDLSNKAWYVHSDMMFYEGEGFTNDANVNLNLIPNISENKVVVNLDINNEDKSNLLGYEISMDGEVVAFTRDNTLTLENIDVNNNVTFTAKAYDLKMNTVDSSQVKLHAPSLNITDEITIELGSEFDIKNRAVAKNYKGEDISSEIKTEGNIDTSKRGNYEIKLLIEDSEIKVYKTINVSVVSRIDFASDLPYNVISSGYGGIRKDKAPDRDTISLAVNGSEIVYTKGLGAHANSEVEFNIKDKKYTHFYAVLGIDGKVRNANNPSAKYKVLADGVEIYESKEFKSNTNAEALSLEIPSNTQKITLITESTNASLSQDQTVWANARFSTSDTKPMLEVEDNLTTKVGQPIENLIGNYTAKDLEDGDLTSKVKVSVPKEINFNKPGTYEIKYSVEDLDKNKTEVIRELSIVHMKDAKYLTDYDWKSASQSYSTTKKDKASGGNAIRLTGEDGKEVTYERGLGTHANATVIYDLSDKDYKYFTSYVGVDRNMYNSVASITFEVYVDGVKKFDSGLMTSKDVQKYIEVDINGANELKLVVTDGGNGIGSDHGSWGDTKLHFVNSERADITKLEEAIQKAEAIQRDEYTTESLQNLDKELNNGKKLLEQDFISEDKCEETIQNIEEAIEKLEILNMTITIDDTYLNKKIREALNIGDREITLKDMHNLKSLDCSYGYVETLKGLEYAINLESLNIDFNEVRDIYPVRNLKKLKNFTGKENFVMSENYKAKDGKFIIEDIVTDLDGERILPKEVVISPNKNPIKLDISDVLEGNKVIIDASLIEENTSVEILYESEYNNYQLYVMSFLILN